MQVTRDDEPKRQECVLAVGCAVKGTKVFEMAMISKEAQQQVLYLLRNVGKKIREMQGDPTWRNVLSFEGF